MTQLDDINSEIKIEQGIPIPSTRGTVPVAVEAMEVGDSFLGNQRQRNAAFASAYTRGIKLTSRTQADGSVRIWRVR